MSEKLGLFRFRSALFLAGLCVGVGLRLLGCAVWLIRPCLFPMYRVCMVFIKRYVYMCYCSTVRMDLREGFEFFPSVVVCGCFRVYYKV